MALTLDGTAGITFPVTAGSASAVQASSGRVLQLINATFTSTTSTTSSTYATTGYSASITPSSASSKIYVVFNCCLRPNSSANTQLTLYRGATNLEPTSNRGFIQDGPNNVDRNQSLMYLDSPATTSSTTYTIYMRSENNSSISYICIDGGPPTTIQLMEIAA
jgi:hypothetical protein